MLQISKAVRFLSPRYSADLGRSRLLINLSQRSFKVVLRVLFPTT